ncbi:MAG: YicC/YloC family endoribonuclease [Acidobacteriota bacterium]
MIRSMTGYGRSEGAVGEGATAEISVRSVNHRFLDLSFKIRESEASLEPVLRKAFATRVSRGKVEVTARLRRDSAGRAGVTVDEALLASAVERVQAAAAKLSLAGRLEARDLLAIPGAFSVENGSGEFSSEEIGAVEAIAVRAAEALVAMRETEGREIAGDLGRRVETLRGKTGELALRRDEISGRLLANLKERLAALVPGLPLDSGRLEQEAAIAVDRADVAEELQRLDGHLSQFRELLDTDGPVGKKLEFLTQEILRELNTLGSKSKDLQLVRDVLEMKSETEKIREQVQNVE